MKETVRGKEINDVLIDLIDECMADETASATEKLQAITAALALIATCSD